jgi:hypothetical protein
VSGPRLFISCSRPLALYTIPHIRHVLHSPCPAFAAPLFAPGLPRPKHPPPTIITNLLLYLTTMTTYLGNTPLTVCLGTLDLICRT